MQAVILEAYGSARALSIPLRRKRVLDGKADREQRRIGW
jgi:hypothetical protein